jgi:SAM-dependent methyltransferase
MKFATDLRKGILGGSDSPELWTDIISNISDSTLLQPNVRILVVACGHGTEAVLLAQRMMALGMSKNAVNKSIWLIDKYQVFTNHAKLVYGFRNVITEDFLNWTTDMKFDTIVGNPPYQDPTGQNTLYPKFYAKAVELVKPDGYIAMITPPAIIPGLFGVKNPDGIRMPEPLQIEKIVSGNLVKQYFNGVASEFCYFVLKNAEADNTSVPVTIDAGTVRASGPIFPRVIDSKGLAIAQSILNKCSAFNRDPYSATSGDYGRNAYTDPKGKHKAVEAISTDGTVRTRRITWIKTPHSHLGSPKVIMPMYGKTAVVDYSHNLVSAAQEKTPKGNLTGHNICTVLTASDQESESLMSILDSRIQRFFNAVTNENRSQYVNFLKNFTGVPLDQIYTNNTLESALKLTAKEKAWLSANY